MKTVQFNANNILNGNNYPIAYYYPIAKDLVIISTGHDDSIIDGSMGYSAYIHSYPRAIQKTSIKIYPLYLASITSTSHLIIKVLIPGSSLHTLHIPMPISNISRLPYTMYSAKTTDQCDLIINYVNNTFIITDIYSC